MPERLVIVWHGGMISDGVSRKDVLREHEHKNINHIFNKEISGKCLLNEEGGDKGCKRG